MRLERFSLRLADPLETANGPIEAREGFLVRVGGPGGDGGRAEDGDEDGNGDGPASGLGEATPLPGWTESLDDCRAALDGGNPDATTPAARHGVSLARADADARRAGERLCDRLAAEGPFDSDGVTDAVPVNATVGDGTSEETADAVRDAVDEGFDAVKVKVGAREAAADRERLRAARDAAPDAELRADANGAWDRETAEEMLDAAADLGFAYVEQPLSAENLSGLASLRGRGVGVGVDESLASHSAREVLAADAADVLVLKPMALGGPDRTLDAARAARDAGADAVVTTTIDGVVARLGALHVAAAVPDVRACGLATGSLLAEDLGPDPAPVRDGEMTVPEGPGLAGGALDSLY
ncbi:mandelate racemase/muconate lactonizing enzyme family protein [Halogeometricum luteum]|uniref:o-succinylbenzoate synthase n=1 Tax=Halogeometricum luteum TaxID=2950537 RepID=A0ABU2FXA7_9EURY|nr:enolase C-terminal domain-like protein [Halogeometricum sp. S3BR5-2]MDS0292836.1 o-succinylbenzoate synthase [Halogeometricum sp. S3BR5-2]